MNARTAPRDPIIELLRRTLLFAELDDEVLEKLAERCRRRSYPAGTALFHQDDPGVTMYLIVSGKIVIERVHESTGETIHIAERGSGEHVGEMALLDGAPRSADAVTRTDCDLLMLDRSDFLACLEQSPLLALAIIRSLAERLRATNDALVAFRTQDVLGRLAGFLLDEARPAASDSASPELRLREKWTQQQIADRIGTTKESVNRSLARLKRLTVVRQDDDGYIVITDPKKLGRYSAA